MYGELPPVGLAVALPVLEQAVALLFIDGLGSIAAGAVIVTVTVAEMLLLSFTVMVYVPALNPVAVALVPPLGDQE